MRNEWMKKFIQDIMSSSVKLEYDMKEVEVRYSTALNKFKMIRDEVKANKEKKFKEY